MLHVLRSEVTVEHIKVGTLANRSGLTVRTLHHYDEIGLLRPSGRTPSGHRLYSDDDVRRLQQIASLKQLGLPLDEIARWLDRPGASLESVLELHAERLERRIGEQRKLQRAIERALAASRGRGVSADQLLETIAATTRYDRYYSEEELAALARRADDLGPEGMAEGQRAWLRVIGDFRSAFERGEAPESKSVQRSAAAAAALIDQFTGGDAATERSLSTLYREEGAVNVMADHGIGMTEELWAFMQEAIRIARDRR